MSEADLREQFVAAIRMLEEHPRTALTDEGTNAAAQALRVGLEAIESSMGECRQAVPYSPLRPVIDSQGVLRWCCNHVPEHCSAAQGD
ncbi:MAG: hypothetical protein QOC78_1375 [Solirubrobacteraceae bacterium]|jgi:hypothetical protein|nr:hypothetical protein [Solirubrobacteraceae bacterium]